MKGLGALQRHQLPHPPCKNPGSATGRRRQFMRTNVTRQFRSRERKCMGTKRPGTDALTVKRYVFLSPRLSHIHSPIHNCIKTLRTQDTSDLRHFGTTVMVPKCPDIRHWCRSVLCRRLLQSHQTTIHSTLLNPLVCEERRRVDADSTRFRRHVVSSS